MNKSIKILAGLAVLGILAALYVWFYVYHKPHRDYATAEPDHHIEAEALFYQYRHDKSFADSLYTGMVLQLTGELMKVETRDSVVTVVFVFEQGMFGDEGIRCTLMPGHHVILKDYDIGSNIVIKGYCTGYNDTDVVLEKATIVRSE